MDDVEAGAAFFLSHKAYRWLLLYKVEHCPDLPFIHNNLLKPASPLIEEVHSKYNSNKIK